MRYILLTLLVLAVPAGAALAAPSSFSVARSVLVDKTSSANAYAIGATAVVTAPVAGDLSAFGGSVIVAAPVSGDDLLFAGSVYSRARVGGDLRAVGGTISIDEPVAGDVVVAGYAIHDAGRPAGSVFALGANVTLSNGAGGPVTIYGNNVALAGDFAGDVTIFAGGRVTLAASTTIAGTLTYQSPEEAIIPASAVVRGGVFYTSASYLPDAGTSRILSVISIGFFLFVRILGALILAGLIAGLFPRLAESLVERAVGERVSKTLLTALLGFAVFIVAPVLCLLLALTFVGLGLALLGLILYALLALLALIYAGILVGSLLARKYARRETVLWRDGVLGTLILSIITLVPGIGLILVLFLTSYAAGALSRIFFSFAFPHEEETPELL